MSLPKELKILLAEDDKDDVFIFQIALEELDLSYTLRHVENGDLLIDALMTDLPDILFLDINMPCKDGIACIQAIRKREEFNSLPIIMYTSHLLDKIVDECFDNGANRYLRKADSIQQLTESLQKIFSLNWATDYDHSPREMFVIN